MYELLDAHSMFYSVQGFCEDLFDQTKSWSILHTNMSKQKAAHQNEQLGIVKVKSVGNV